MNHAIRELKGWAVGDRAGRRAVCAVALLACGSVALDWFGLTRVYPLAAGLVHPSTTWPPLVGYTLGAGLRHILIDAGRCLLYVLALEVLTCLPGRASRPAVGIIVAGWLAHVMALLPIYPGDSLDIFEYLFRGRMQAIWGASPLQTAPAAFQLQPFYDYLTWHDWVDAYGPLWEYASGTVARIVGATTRGTLTDYIIGYRLLAVGLTAVCAVLVALIVQHRDPQQVPAALLAWLWNPLLLGATVVGAHNDGLMLVAILAALLAVQRRHWWTALVALGLAMHVKVTAGLFVPPVMVWMLAQAGVQRTLRSSLGAVGLLVPLSWVLYQPYGGWATLPRMLRERAILTYNSLANVVYDLLQLRWHWTDGAARQAAIRGSTAGFLLVGAALIAWFAWQSRPTTDERLLWQIAGMVMLAYLLIGCFWFQSWYVTWVLVVAVLLPASRWTRRGLPALALGALWSNVLTDFLNQDLQHRLVGVQVDTLMVLTLLVPLGLVVVGPTVWHVLHRRRLRIQRRWHERLRAGEL